MYLYNFYLDLQVSAGKMSVIEFSYQVVELEMDLLVREE